SLARFVAFVRDAERTLSVASLAVGNLPDVVGRMAERFFALVVELGAESDRHRSIEGRQMLARDAWSGALLEAYHALDNALEALEHFAESNGVNEAVRLVAERAATLRAETACVVEPATHDATWVEARGRSIAIGATPTDIGGVLRDEVFDRVGAAVLT